MFRVAVGGEGFFDGPAVGSAKAPARPRRRNRGEETRRDALPGLWDVMNHDGSVATISSTSSVRAPVAPRFVARQRPSLGIRRYAGGSVAAASGERSWRETCLLAGACPSDDFE
jgi:hypothetical protein